MSSLNAENVALKNVDHQIKSVLNGGDILLIVPPFSRVESSTLGVHILQTLAVEKGFKTEVLYLNILLSSVLKKYHINISDLPVFDLAWQMLYERLFARSAYNMPPMGEQIEACFSESISISGTEPHQKMFYLAEEFDQELFLKIEEICTLFVEESIKSINSLGYKVVGCSQMEGQTNCSIALLNGIKNSNPDVLTLIGGPNCRGVLAKGVASLSDKTDYIFSGESESSFCNFLDSFKDNQLPSHRIINELEPVNLDHLALSDYSSFFEQTKTFLGESAVQKASICYETSRGCWWMQKKGCGFCSEPGILKEKSASKIIKELEEIKQIYPESLGVFMSDVAMPQSFKKNVIPSIKENQKIPKLGYQIKATVNLQELIEYKKANISQFTVGIEALSNGLLKTMQKGTTVRQNIQTLRYGKSLGLYLDWVLLWGMPGDKKEYYQETIDIIPLIQHLQPPITFLHLFLGRYSPFFEKAENLNISNIRPWNVYNMIFPKWADIENLAYWFVADYPCESHENKDLIRRLSDKIIDWRKNWLKKHLFITKMADAYVIFDNRGVNDNVNETISKSMAIEVMLTARYQGSEAQQWAINNKMAVIIGSWYIPLITATEDLLIEFDPI